MSFTYKGTNINELVSQGTGTVKSGTFVNFPTFATSNYSTTDRPLDFQYCQ